MGLLAKNGILVLTSITGGREKIEVHADQLNLDFVLHNKVMFGTVNAHRGYFEHGVRDFAQAEAEHPGWLARLLTHPISGLDEPDRMLRELTENKDAIKVYVNVAD
jgi:threonine dehydrogenase-like Zn-dependent dehydrogenase